MNYVEEHLKDVEQYTSRSYIEKLVGDVIILNTGIVVKDVRERWTHGESVEGGIIGVYRWDDYRMFKRSLNPLAGGNVDLMLTGALSEGLTIRRNGDLFQIYSTDEKYNKIGQQYGFHEFGLTEEQLSDFYEQLYIVVAETILSEIWK